MTYQVEDSALEHIFELLANEGFDSMGEALGVLLDEMMKLERSHHLRAGPYQRTERRQGYANGFKPKRVKTRIGELDLVVPRQSMKCDVAEAIRGVFNALNRQEADRQLDLLIAACQEKAP